MTDHVQRTIYNEARGEGEAGMRAVGSTIYNRYQMNRGYFGERDLDNICSKGYDGYKIGANPVHPGDRAAWEIASAIACELRTGAFHPTNNYTHFGTSRNIFSNLEGPNFTYHERIGNHYFFKEN